MAATSQSQHRCIFVGNIPYDATEEQLIQLCEEVGPVVSFRLVIDRETGKPKGYGFCEYKDEETALSARRNLQGYEINGRQLRVDFAENDKNADRNREQGRGGPGTISSVDPQKQFGGPAGLRDPSFHQPVGDSVAIAAATVMAGALGAAQNSSTSNQVGLQSQSLLGTDPLTRHLAKVSRSQLTEVMSEVKAIATQNKEQARKLLLAFPNLAKALFQAQIMLGMVSPQMLQMPNIRQASAQPVQHMLQGGQTVPGLPPLPQNKLNLLPNPQESQVSPGVSHSYATGPYFPQQSQVQSPQLVQNHALQQGQPLAQPGVPSLLSTHPLSLGSFSARPQIHLPNPALVNHQPQPSLSQRAGQSLPSSSAYNGQSMAHNASTQRMVNDSIDQICRASKMGKLSDPRAKPSVVANLATPLSAPSPTSDLSERRTSMAEEALNPGRQVTQMQLPSGVDSALLQQVLNLSPEQLNSLPPDQQQQVLQLQQMLRQPAGNLLPGRPSAASGP